MMLTNSSVEFLVGHVRWLVELRDQGQHRIEAMFCRNEEFNRSIRFDTHEQAIQWARVERRAIESVR
jgi:hypothetical protein